jgi:hypothetical protein
MTQEEKMKALDVCLYEHCCCNNCDECEFYDELGTNNEDEYECGIRDRYGKTPYHDNWNMKEALGIGERKPSPFPTDITNSMMQHFTKVE